MTGMTGAALLLKTAADAGVKICMANPGTTELGVVSALDEVPEVRPVLGLFEGVCTGAADGYARVTRQPALTLLHLGPGFANGIANLHNARRARSAIINVIGDHASWHLAADSPLTSDIDSLASPVSSAVIRLERGAAMIPQIHEAIRMAKEPPGHIVTLIAPSDFMDEALAELAQQSSPVKAASTSQSPLNQRGIEAAAEQLLNASSPILLLGGWALTERGQRAAAQIADACGARLIMECYPAIVEVGGGIPRVERLAYFPQDVQAQLGKSKVLLADARVPVSYFGYPGQPSVLTPPEQLIPFEFGPAQVVDALEALAKQLASAKPRGRYVAAEPEAAPKRDQLTPIDVAEVLCTNLPAGAIVSLEGSSCGSPFIQRAYRAAKHSIMTNTGGAIGQGLPCGVGAAIARPDAKVICLQSDGSAQYTVQSLWTMAREQLDVVVLIVANNRYGILQTELTRSDIDIARPATARLTRIDTPEVDWVSLAQAYGVPAVKVKTRETFEQELKKSLGTKGPKLIAMGIL